MAVDASGDLFFAERVAPTRKECHLIARRIDVACASVTTLHGRLDIPDMEALFHEYSETPLVGRHGHPADAAISPVHPDDFLPAIADRQDLQFATVRALPAHGAGARVLQAHPAPSQKVCQLTQRHTGAPESLIAF